MIRIAINGFGRIGRNTLKAGFKQKGIEFVAINDLATPDVLAYLLAHDTVYGNYDQDVSYGKDYIQIGKKKIKALAVKDPASLPWKKLKVDIVIESTGIFRTKELASLHLKAGAKVVIISAPAKGDDVDSYLMGVNHEIYTASDVVIDNASCTTNSIGPVADIIHRHLGIIKACMTTVHAYTADQSLVDGPHKDLRRGRSASQNIIPTTTGAADAITKIFPDLQGRFDGVSIRVPIVAGSLTDFTFVVSQETSVKEVNGLLEKASRGKQYKGIVDYSEDDLVSSDIIGDPHSVIIDGQMTRVIDGDLVKVFGWYDNEWGYSNRLVELALHVGSQLQKEE